MKSRLGAIIAGLVVSLAAAFFVIAVSTNNWQTPNISGVGTFRIGLWNLCPPGANDNNCFKIGLSDCAANQGGGNLDTTGGNCAQFNGVRALCILAMIFGIFSAACLLILDAMCTMAWGRYHGLWTGILSGLFGMACMAVMVDLNNKKEHAINPDINSTSYGYSFALLVVGWLLMLGGTAYSGYASAGQES